MKVRPLAIALFYLGAAGLIVVIMYLLNAGKSLELPGAALPRTGSQPDDLSSSFIKALSHPVAVIILQIVLILIVARLCGALFRKMGQPTVVGEIVAGIILGPSLFGAVLPGLSEFVFPTSSLGSLQILSQIGLILFMFVVGMELNLKVLKKEAGAAVVISHASIIIPFVLGVGLAYFLYRSYVSANISFYAFALFMGIAMSITAFPVLARIIRERGLSHTRLGTIAISCAAADDITAWCLLAVVIAIVKAGSMGSSLYVLLFAVAYVAIMYLAVKPLLKRLLAKKTERKTIDRSSLALIFSVLLLSAYCSEVIGIHVLFGAFVAGTIMPADADFRKLLIDKVEDFALVLLLPLFFVYTGLRTQVGLLNDSSLWIDCLLIILVAIAGKFAGSAAAARFMGETPKNSLSIGALMNTRGLVELVVLNIGYELGILGPEIFTMMVLMALVTTFMTNPALNLINRMRDNDSGKRINGNNPAAIKKLTGRTKSSIAG